MNILKYREFVDTECSNQQNTKLNKKAIKIDGDDSLKMNIGCGELKSCDYIRYKRDKILFIEISDLKKQLIDLSDKTSCITQECRDSLDKRIKKRIVPKNIIREEMRTKFVQTDLIFHKLLKFVRFNIEKPKIFTIALCSNNTSDVIAFQYLETDLKSSTKTFLKDVKVVLTKDLEKVI